MSKKKKPRCFVAMAFDKDDTDDLYDNIIKPVLKNNDILPVIINRREDNRDINNQIIDQLNKTDFCIADLTYARPSVYYEAGFAQRNVEVIYTVRSDHLKNGQPDNLRVHFDLQMKPLIQWKDALDSKFQDKLQRRLRQTVLKDWHKKQNIDEKLKIEKKAFLTLSVNNRLDTIRKKSIYKVHQSNFTKWIIKVPNYRHYDHLRYKVFKNPAIHSNVNYTFITYKIKNNELQIISITASEKITKKILEDKYYNELDFFSFRGIKFDVRDKLYKIKKSIEHNIILTLNNTPNSRIMSALPNLKMLDEKIYFLNEIYKERGYRETPDILIDREIYYYFLSNIDSKSKLLNEVDEVINNIKNPIK